MKPYQKQFFALWAQYCDEARIPHDEREACRRELIGRVTGGAKYQWRSLNEQEKKACINEVARHIEPKKMPDSPENNMRKKIIAICCESMDMRRNDRADMTRIDAYMKAHTKFKKKLNELSYDELREVVTQMKEVQKNYEYANRNRMKPVEKDDKTEQSPN
jgi:hypothetical protein